MHSIARIQKILTCMSETGECRQQQHTPHVPSTKRKCDYLNGWIKKRSHEQNSHQGSCCSTRVAGRRGFSRRRSGGAKEAGVPGENPQTTSSRKCDIPKPKTSSPNRDCNTRCSIEDCNTHCSTGDCNTHCSIGDCNTHCSIGDCNTHCSIGDCNTHCSIGDCNTHCSIGDCNTHCSIGDCNTHCSTGESNTHCRIGGSLLAGKPDERTITPGSTSETAPSPPPLHPPPHTPAELLLFHLPPR